MNKNVNNIQNIVCPEGYEFVKPHTKNGKYIVGYCRKSKVTTKQLGIETIEGIPFGYDAIVAKDYLKYAWENHKKLKSYKHKKMK